MKQALFVGLLGAGVFLIGLFKVRKVRASRSWIRATGVIVQASVRESFSQGSDDSPDSWSYAPEVQYQFQAGGREFRGDRISFDRRAYQTKQQAQAALARYPAGGQVEVFFDPANPAQSVLQRASGSGWVLVAAGAGVMLLVIAAAMVSR
jgi:hypothetical protein